MQCCRLDSFLQRVTSVTSVRQKRRLCCTTVKAQTANANSTTDVSTPHSGYHYNGAKRRFFEGWYFKVRLQMYAAVKQTTCLHMFFCNQRLRTSTFLTV